MIKTCPFFIFIFLANAGFGHHRSTDLLTKVTVSNGSRDTAKLQF
jgi:hypothetical protein